MKPLSFRPATSADIPALISLLNQAYRGDASRQGWTHEADLIEGTERTDVTELTTRMQQPDTRFYICTQEDATLLGTVYLEKKQNELYLGMLSVLPTEQGRGIGKQLLAAAEQQARSWNCSAIVMTVISVRTELLDWYERHGYIRTGIMEPFPEDPRYGRPRQQLFFEWLRKPIS